MILAGEHLNLVSALASVAVALGVPFLVASAVRDRGKDLETGLWSSWGGAPATRMLRATEGDADAVDRRQRARQRIGLDLPSAQVQKEDPAGADRQIQSLVDALIKQTKSDAVVQSELGEYGMRRNLLGVRTLGLLCSSVTLGVGLGDLGWALVHDDSSVLAAVAIIVMAMISGIAWRRVRPSWVKVAAERYAAALLR